MISKIQAGLYKFKHTLVIITFALVALIISFSFIEKLLSREPYSIISLEKSWKDENGVPFSLENFGSASGDPNLPQRIYFNTTIKDINTVLVFRSRNCYTNIYINGTLLEEDKPVKQLYGTSPGSRWHMSALGFTDKPVEICLEVTACFGNAHGLIDNIYLGKASDILRQVMSGRFVDFTVNVFLMIIGLILIGSYGYMKKHFKISADLIFLGLATFFCAVWSSTESLLWQFFFGHSEVVHLCEYLALAAIPLSFGLLASRRLKGWERIFTNVYSIIGCINLIVISVLNVTGIWEFHYSLPLTHILLVILIPIMVRLVLSYTNEASQGSHRAIIILLLCILVICIATSLFKYITGSYQNYSTYVRTALLCFLLCLIIFQLNLLVNTFSKGLKADMLHDLALKDYMTGLFNRTAFAEHRYEYEHLIASFSPLGVIQFDVNNLKKVNDTLGHEKGDQMIKAVAEGLKQSFPANACSYRMGGDEFLTIITDRDPDTVYQKGIDALTAYCQEQNAQPDLGFKLQIAHGYLMIKGNLSLEEAMEEADGMMYENKRMLKSEQKS